MANQILMEEDIDIALIVDQDGEKIDNIELNIDTSEIEISEGVDQLSQAEHKHHNNRK